MYDPDASFDLVWAPTRYPDYNVEEMGVWRLVLDGDDPVGVVWSNRSTSAGVSWYRQTDAVTRLFYHFISGARAGTPANFAYINAENVQGVTLGTEMSGPLQGVPDLLEELIEESS